MFSEEVVREAKRKRIHYVGLIVPLLYYFVFTRTELLIFTGLALGAFLLIDYFRIYRKNKYISYFFERESYNTSIRLKTPNGKREIQRDVSIPTFSPLLRSEERRTLGGQTFFALGSFVCILLFPKNIAIAAMAVLVVGDSVAAMVGMTCGRHRIYGKKTLEGFLGCLVASTLICLLLLPLDIALVGGLVGAVTELVTLRLNDNLTIPVATGAAMTVVYYLPL
jgi:dolichol kinase